jgi:hypothetical protein
MRSEQSFFSETKNPSLIRVHGTVSFSGLQENEY